MKRNALYAATVAAAGLLLSACAPSYVLSGVEVQSSASGKVDLTTFSGSFVGDSVRTIAGQNTTASVTAKANYTKGNWDISGTWSDGFVKFRFTGVALSFGVLSGTAAAAADTNAALAAFSQSSSNYGGSWVSGGCMPFPTYYTSTNSNYPGTGVAIVVLCDQGPGAGFGFLGEGNVVWTDPDYVAVYIPDTTDMGPMSDNSPYRYYTSGGYMTGRKSVVSVKARESWTSPTSTIDPLWTPSSSSPPPPAQPN
jgi:hypothetical protein